MKVALFNDSFPPQIDGVANAVVNYAKIINDGKNSSVAVVPEYPGADDSCFDFPVVRYPALDMSKLTGYYAGTPFHAFVEKDLKEAGVDILHSHCPIASTLMARSLRKPLDVPIVLTYHTKFDLDIANVIKLKLMQESAIRALVANISSCDEVWTVSDGAGANLRSLGYEGDYYVVENGVDVPNERLDENLTRKLTEECGIPENVPVYLFVGRLMWYKGIKIILDALAALKSQDYDFCAIFVGSGSDEQEIRSYVSSHGLGGKIIFTGPVSDREKLRALYCRADLMLFPSTFDTNGLVVREAAACSLPAVLVKGSCAAEGVKHCETGFLIDEDPASMAVCLTTLNYNKSLVKEVGSKASSNLYISWNQAVAKAMDRYEVVIDKYKSGGYKRKHRVMDDFFTLMGDAMETINKIKDRNDIF